MKADAFRVEPEQPHWPLIIMTVLTQASVGAFCALLFEQMTSSAYAVRSAAVASLLVAFLALGSSTLHLGRPVYAWRALSMWRRSWLSREVLLFTIFAGLGIAYSVALWWSNSAALVLGVCTVIAGIAGAFASARIYCVRARPAWNSGHTVAEFLLSAALTGPIFAALLLPGSNGLLLTFAAGTGCAAVLQQIGKLLWLANSESFELRATAALLSTRLRSGLLLRAAGLIGLILLLSHSGSGLLLTGTALVLALTAEMLGRWLFFVSVVPKNMASSYLREAA